jgi:hypothetical protein
MMKRRSSSGATMRFTETVVLPFSYVRESPNVRASYGEDDVDPLINLFGDREHAMACLREQLGKVEGMTTPQPKLQ